MVTSTDTVKVTLAEGVATVRLDRGEKLNALNREMRDAIVTIFDALDSDDDVEVVVLSSTSDRAFSAGADVTEMADRDAGGSAPYDPMRGVMRNLYEVVLECRKPTIAALRGWVVGGGMELAMACDMRIAARSTRFLMPEARVGLGANFGSQMLPRLVARAHAFEILYTARDFGAQRASDIGFVSRVVADEAIDVEADALARLVASRAPLTLRRYKAMISIGSSLPIATALRLDPGTSPYSSADRAEGARAFTEGREPMWEGR
jgi:enoyl-CoA hydratase/carnithine racemase